MLDEASSETIETTLLELLEAIQEVTGNDDEAFVVLECMVAAGRVSVGPAPARAA